VISIIISMNLATRFSSRYGPWGVVFGASEGTGAEFGRQIAAQGVNVVLVARRREQLDAVAAEIHRVHGVSTATCVVDLSSPGSLAEIVAQTKDLEVGLLVFNAGSSDRLAPFLELTRDEASALVQRNCLTPLAACHHFGRSMVARRRGGVVLITSVTGLAGAPGVATYAATKAFVTMLAEALWCEWSPAGVDVLAPMLGLVDTPTFRRVLSARGRLPDETSIAAMTTSAEEVVRDSLSHLEDGPVYVVGERAQSIAAARSGFPRRAAVEHAMAAAARR
jgi:uncharacterized protein